MPNKPAAPCPSPGCPSLQPCATHRPKRRWDRRLVLSRQARGYDRTHELLRLRVLREEPLCQLCHVRTSTISDHIVPLSRGGKTERSNLQGVCVACHETKTRSEKFATTSRTGRGR